MAARIENRDNRRRKARTRHAGVAVDEEQRKRLIECCAFFAAARFRPDKPGGYRRQDLLAARRNIDAILARHKAR